MRLLDALNRVPLDRPPVWIMRQAGRYLPEYRELRKRHSFGEAVRTPAVAAEITLQPLRRFALDAAIVFQDIMTPLGGLGIEVAFEPGPRLVPQTLEEVVALPELDVDRVSFVLETIGRVRRELPGEVALVGFAGAPATLLAYLLEGGGSRDFLAVRRALYEAPSLAKEALSSLARSMGIYLAAQVEAGADVVQLFDSWVGVLPRAHVARFALPAAVEVLQRRAAPTIYFAPRTEHVLDLLPAAGADCYGVDWRVPLGEAWKQLGLERCIQGNLDPAVLLTSPGQVRAAVEDVLEQAAGRPGHVFNLGHGIVPESPPESVAALVEAVRGE
ncbi:MAG: uroporphyrinogen decarboxylase [Actinomycetota bacterium]|nr:uroporphyrinogen decarboxylase [Actinomycetota bacterium]